MDCAGDEHHHEHADGDAEDRECRANAVGTQCVDRDCNSFQYRENASGETHLTRLLARLWDRAWKPGSPDTRRQQYLRPLPGLPQRSPTRPQHALAEATDMRSVQRARLRSGHRRSLRPCSESPTQPETAQGYHACARRVPFERQSPQCAQTRLSLIHISEPTRQAEISYAVFCLKKKKKK